MCYTWSFRMWLHRSVLHVLWYVQGDNVIYLCIHKLSVVHVWVNLLLKRLWERKGTCTLSLMSFMNSFASIYISDKIIHDGEASNKFSNVHVQANLPVQPPSKEKKTFIRRLSCHSLPLLAQMLSLQCNKSKA
uniref:Putative secreted protein n=1 Tax=Rhipicephalus microplus TaxID=6941 RepID=A0A6G5A091_RHIMP